MTDYGTGNVGVVDARTGTVVSQVSTGATSGANDVLVAADGSVYAVARSIEGASAIETDYTIDKTTGEYRTSSTEPKGKDNADSPITPGVMVKINTTVETTAKPAAQTSSEELVKTYADGAKLYAMKDWTTGETLKLRGEGFKTQDGSKGSVLAVKLNKYASPRRKSRSSTVPRATAPASGRTSRQMRMVTSPLSCRTRPLKTPT